MPAVRGTGIQSGISSAYTVTWPTGTLAGDLAIIFATNGWPIVTPSGWTSLNSSSGSNTCGAVFWRTLTSGDITTGSVTVSPAAVYYGVVAIITFVGSSAIRECVADRETLGVATALFPSTSGAVISGDTGIYFAANRGVSTVTVNRGALQQTISATEASGALYAELISAPGAVQPTGTFTPSASGYYVATVIVEAAPPVQLQVSKAGLYAVTEPPVGAAVSKVNLYAVVTPGSDLSLSCGNPPVGVVGVPYSHAFPASGGTPPYTFGPTPDLGMLAALNMTLDPATGILSGTPQLITIYYFEITVTDSA